MTEFRAILMVFVAMSIATLGSGIALSAIHAPGMAFALIWILILIAAADTCSRIDMHYESKSDRR
jgi:hypothetical protein